MLMNKAISSGDNGKSKQMDRSIMYAGSLIFKNL